MAVKELESRINETVDAITALINQQKFEDDLRKIIAKKVHYLSHLTQWEQDFFFTQPLEDQDQASRDKIAVLFAELKSDLATSRKRDELHLTTDEPPSTPG